MGISWRDELATGDDRIDNQHRELLNRFDTLLAACRNGEGRSELVKLLDFLDDYVVLHFGDEENLQRIEGFPDYHAHRLQHRGFIERVDKLKKDIAKDGDIQLDHVLSTNKMLLDWLVNHISSSDRALGNYIKSKAA